MARSRPVLDVEAREAQDLGSFQDLREQVVVVLGLAEGTHDQEVLCAPRGCNTATGQVDPAVQLHSPETPLGVCFFWDDWAIAALGQI